MPDKRHPRQRHCSKRCRDRAWYLKRHPRPESKVCEACGDVFNPAENCPQQKFCSPTCRGTYWARQNSDKKNARQRLARLKRPQHHKDCDRRRRQEHKEAIAVTQRRYYEGNKELYLAAAHRRLARKRGLPDTLTANDVAEKLAAGQCFYCGATEHLTLDHFLPVIGGGGTTRANIVIACASCNSSKGAKMPDEYLAQLAFA